jgi:DNA-binding response OmpR family regulator
MNQCLLEAPSFGAVWDTPRFPVSLGESSPAETLRRTEQLLLEYLRANAGRPVPRQELAANVWHLKMDPRSRTIDQTISTLRRKLPAHTRILTRHQVGYEYAVG